MITGKNNQGPSLPPPTPPVERQQQDAIQQKAAGIDQHHVWETDAVVGMNEFATASGPLSIHA